MDFIMKIRYSTNPNDAKNYTTEQLREEFLVTEMYIPDTVTATYSHVDRMVVLGIMPVKEAVSLDKGIDIMKNFGTSYFLERREAGFFNIGGSGVCVVDGVRYNMESRDCIYVSRGTKTVTFESSDAASPARFYGVSAPAHKDLTTRLVTLADAIHVEMGSNETSNKRVINQYLHPDVLETCQLLMGLTALEKGSVWNTMPSHTHERRMEVYTYFDMDDDNIVFHLMGHPQETRHIVVKNYDSVISPSWSIHSGCGTSNYSFIWAMGGENQTFTDMDTFKLSDFR